jgi:undecaprenyl-diphosphatase
MGILQGVTELFPVSSLGHGVLFPALFGWTNLVNSQSHSESFFLSFLVGLHVGTAIGLIAYFRSTWLRLAKGIGRQCALARRDGLSTLFLVSTPNTDADYKLVYLLILGTIPVGVVGLAFEHNLRTLFAKPLSAAIFLALNGLMMLGGELVRRRSSDGRSVTAVSSLTPRNALIVGSSQILALFAGISRSGASMVTGLVQGLSHEEAANFSFLLATPVILLAGVYKLPDLIGPLGNGVRLQALVGALCAMVASYFSVKFLSRWFSTHTLWPFGVYSLVVGLACVGYFA